MTAVVTVIIPTFNEAPNIAELVGRVVAACIATVSAEILFVDDSLDDTPDTIRSVAKSAPMPIRLIHRDSPTGGLAGAVLAGIEASESKWCLVMDGDLQHPPEMIPVLIAVGEESGCDVVVASRRVVGGSSVGLSNVVRHAVSAGSTALSRAMFPLKLRNCSDPMTGFFAVRRASIDLSRLRPRGFKILLEILGRHSLTVVEEPFVFGERFAGTSKADFRQGLRFLGQLASLRFGRLSGFSLVGAAGAVANLAIMAVLINAGTWYLSAAIVSAVLTIVSNFLLLEHFVFRDLRSEGRGFWRRFAQSFAFNGTETMIRTALLMVIVETTNIPSLVGQAGLLCIGFLIRFVFHARVVYRPGRSASIQSTTLLRTGDTQSDVSRDLA
jgi:dolichol-phosphate mannosyltransferase